MGKRAKEVERCVWPGSDPLYVAYHDSEWGVPLHDDRALFEFLILEGAQAGLSWLTILKKREAYRAAFDQFEAAKVALYGEEKILELLADAGIVRNRLKVRAAVRNAQAFLNIQAEFTSFDDYVWAFVGGKTMQPGRRSGAEIPVSSAESDALSKDLLKRGFTFVGTTICYSFLQATGMVNDHVITCFRHAELVKSAAHR